MEKQLLQVEGAPNISQEASSHQRSWPLTRVCAAAALLVLGTLYLDPFALHRPFIHGHRCSSAAKSTYGEFPKPDDPFHLLPCTSETRPPHIDDPTPEASWAKLWDPSPENWNWGKREAGVGQDDLDKDIYAGRGIYLCGYLDVPMDYTNQSDPRISRQAIIKYQVSGLKRLDGGSRPSAGKKSVRTLVLEPGGPGGSGQAMLWGDGENISKRWSNGTFDLLAWDPRGVNATYPAMSCFPSNAHRDRWRLLTGRNRRLVPEGSTLQQLQIADAMSDAMFQYCLSKYGDLPRFMTTAFVARDLERIRQALGEDELTAFMVSYGTGIAQTYAAMFPDYVGRMILDANEFFPAYQTLGPFASDSFDNVTDAWHDGFLADCVNAGPDSCVLAKPRKEGEVVTLQSLNNRMEALLGSVIYRPIAAYSEKSGPGLITYTFLADTIYGSMYVPFLWPRLAEMLASLEAGNTTKALDMMNNEWWTSDPGAPFSKISPPSNDELVTMVICPEAYDAPEPGGLEWWDATWANMTQASWISGDMRFFYLFPCRRFYKYWPKPAEVYRGGFNKTLKNPMLLISGIYDPATPLRSGRRLQQAFGHDNARLVVHHGYGHGSNIDVSDCTDAIGQKYILEGILPDEEVHCYPNTKPFDPRKPISEFYSQTWLKPLIM